jgi:hypothetical protein
MGELTTRDLTTSIWWNPFTIERIRLRTPHSPDECIRRIQANINSYTYWRGENWRTDDPAKRPFLGRAGHSHFTLVKNPKSTQDFLKGNAFPPVAIGEILPDAASADGSIISIRLSLHLFARIWWTLLLAFLGALLFLGWAGAIGVVSLGPDPYTPLGFIVGAALAGCVAYLFYLMAFWLSRGERVFLVTTLQHVLQASEPAR